MTTRTTTRTNLSVRSVIVLLAVAMLSMAFRPAIAAAETPQATTEAQADDTAFQRIDDAIIGDADSDGPGSTGTELAPELGSSDAITSIFEVSEVRGVDGPYAQDAVLVELKEGYKASTLDRATPVIEGWYLVATNRNETVESAIERLLLNPAVKTATPNYLAEIDPPAKETASIDPTEGTHGANSTNDPHVGLQWHLDQIRVFDAWNKSTGSGVTVAVLDTGIARNGSDLDCRTFVSSYNALTNTTNVTLDVSHPKGGHGTHVAGTIAQCTNNGKGVAGVAPNVKLMDIKVCGIVGGTFTCPSSAIARGIDWARTHGADVINMSLGSKCAATYPTCSTAITNQAIDKAAAAGIVIVVASGNDARGFVGSPANHPNVIGVGAVDTRGVRAPYSNYGPGIDISAPGGDNSVDRNGDGYKDGVLQQTFNTSGTFGYHFYSGTSMASPHVTGVAALVKARYPNATRTDVTRALINTAQDLGAGGYDTVYGSGLLRADRAINYFGGSDTTAPSVSMKPPRLHSGKVAWASGELPVKIDWTASDASGIKKYVVYVSIQGGAWKQLSLSTNKSQGTWMLKRNTSYRFAVRAVDKAGNASVYKYTSTFKPATYNEKNSSVKRSTGWKFYSNSAAYDGRYAYSSTKGAWAKLTFSGRSVAVLAPKWASGKKIDLYIDGKFIRTVSLQQSTTKHRNVVFSYFWSSKGTHTVKLVVRGATGGASAGFDGFVVLR